jgi:hypothetical protein
MYHLRIIFILFLNFIALDLPLNSIKCSNTKNTTVIYITLKSQNQCHSSGRLFCMGSRMPRARLAPFVLFRRYGKIANPEPFRICTSRIYLRAWETNQ